MPTQIEKFKLLGFRNERLEIFYRSEIDKYQDYILEEAPGYFPEGMQVWIDFSVDISLLMKDHKEMLNDESNKDNRIYLPFATLVDTIDFYAIDVSDSKCPVYFGDTEDGDFKKHANSLDDFLSYIIEPGRPEY